MAERITLTPSTVVATSNRLASDPRKWRVCVAGEPVHYLGRGWARDRNNAQSMNGPAAVLAVLNLIGSTDWWGSVDTSTPITWSDLFLEEAP